MSSVTMSTTARTGPNAAIAPAGPAAARAAPAAVPVTRTRGRPCGRRAARAACWDATAASRPAPNAARSSAATCR